MAGKSAAVHGLVHDATPFRFSEENTAIDYHGKLLEEGEKKKSCKIFSPSLSDLLKTLWF